jgi:hypothetical protein
MQGGKSQVGQISRYIVSMFSESTMMNFLSWQLPWPQLTHRFICCKQWIILYKVEEITSLLFQKEFIQQKINKNYA